jgi:MFS family permease
VSWIVNRELLRYPRPAVRFFALIVTVIVWITLWYQYFLAVCPSNILFTKLRMSFLFFIFTIIVFNLIGVSGHLFVGVSDRIGRCWVVIIGLGVAALLQLFAVAHVTNKVEYILAISAFGLFEIGALAVTGELLSDFTPRFRRASIAGFSGLGAVAGFLAAVETIHHTVDPTSGDW